MKKDNVQLTTVGKLLKDLKRYEKKHWDLSVIAWTDDDRIFGVVGTWKDEDGAYILKTDMTASTIRKPEKSTGQRAVSTTVMICTGMSTAIPTCS